MMAVCIFFDERQEKNTEDAIVIISKNLFIATACCYCLPV